MTTETFDGVRLTTKANVYFDGKCVSHSFTLPDGTKKSVGVVLPATLTFGTAAAEIMECVAGSCEYKLDGTDEPLPEAGPDEIRALARALNRSRSRITALLEDRTRTLLAISHDLRTPITRLRLRTELLDDAELRAKFVKDLAEMEAMVSSALDFMRGLDSSEPAQPVDIMALIESIAADAREVGGHDGRILVAVVARSQADEAERERFVEPAGSSARSADGDAMHGEGTCAS